MNGFAITGETRQDANANAYKDVNPDASRNAGKNAGRIAEISAPVL